MDAKPVMVIEAVHRLGGGGKDGIENGKAVLRKIADANPDISDTINRACDRIDFLCANSASGRRGENKGVKEFAEYLSSPNKPVNVSVLNLMMGSGGSKELIMSGFHNLKRQEGFISLKESRELVNGIAISGRSDLYHEFTNLSPNTFKYVENRFAFTPLHTAAEHGHLNVVKYIIEKAPQLLTIRSSNKGSTESYLPVHVVVKAGHLDILKHMVEVNPKLLQKETLTGHDTPLSLAIKEGNVDIVAYIINEQPELLNHISVARELIEQRSSSGGENIVKYIINKTPELMKLKDDEGNTLLHFAVHHSKTDIATFMIDKNPMILKMKNNKGDTPLHLAASAGRADIVQHIVNREDKADYIDLMNGVQRRTPLSKAASKGRAETVIILLAAGADKTIRDWRGRLPQTHAKLKGYSELAVLIGN